MWLSVPLLLLLHHLTSIMNKMSSHFSINQLLVVVVVVVGLGVVLVVVVVVVVVGTVVVVAFVVVVVGAAVVISTLCETKKRIETTIFQ